MKTISLYPHQQKIMDYVKTHPSKQTYHFVAPPGAGKTIVGLSLIEYFNKKTLILVPSLLLKEQWKNQAEQVLDCIISTDFTSPNTVTISTYQSVYQKLKENTNFLKKEGYELIVLDEAHHLKKSWGTLLSEARELAGDMVSLSLTATPPLSSEYEEWQTYLNLNGPIDEEISVTELINQGLLHPYQDFVYFVQADTEIERSYANFYNQQNQMIDRMQSDEAAIELFAHHPFMVDPMLHTQEIYESFELYLSMLLFLSHNKFNLSTDHWQILGFKKQYLLPELSRKNLTTLYDWLWKNHSNLSIFDILKKERWLKEDELCLFPEFPKEKLLGSYEARMNAVNHIIIKEEANLQEKLCGLILFERICEDAFEFPDNPSYYGVVPQFLRLIPLLNEQTEIAMICGSFLILSQTLAKIVFKNESEIHPPYLTNYVKINLTDSNRKSILKQVTDLLESNRLNLLLGTVALLGEGWNCTNINTLILANHSSSYVQIQQLRGRVLRIKEQKPLSTIWHIGQYFPGLPWNEQPELAPIIQRLSFIEGISSQQVPEYITTGKERLHFPNETTKSAMDHYNQENFFFAQHRKLLASYWQEALQKGSHLTMPVFIKKMPEQRCTEFYSSSKKAASFQLTRLTFWQALLQGSLPLYFHQQRSKRQWRKNCQLRLELTEALYTIMKEKRILGDNSKLAIHFDNDQFYIQLTHASYQEERLFNQYIMEMMTPALESRYLLKVEEQYFCIPKEFAKSKQTTLPFFKEIEKKRANCELIYTKNILGRQKLVQAHISSLQEQKIDISQERLWQ